MAVSTMAQSDAGRGASPAESSTRPAQEEQIPGPSDAARVKTFDKTPLASIEYPSTVSHPSAIFRLVTQDDMNACFNAPASKEQLLELRLGGLDRPGPPIVGHRVQTQKLLVKLTKRRRRTDDDSDANVHAGDPSDPSQSRVKGKAREGAEHGVFTTEIVGPIPQTVRFRSMADFRYAADPNGRTSQVVGMLRDLDYDAILDYSVPRPDETFVEPGSPSGEGEPEPRSTLDLQPLPQFNDRLIPMIYNFKTPTASTVEVVEDERTGKQYERLANRNRFVAQPVQIVSHLHAPGDVPSTPIKSVVTQIPRLDPRLRGRLIELFNERPVWSRPALLAQFDQEDRRVLQATKAYIPSVAYTFGAGPFWKTLVRLGYDPCVDPESRFYQRIYFYLNVNRPGRWYGRASLGPDGQEPAGNSGTHKSWEALQEELVAQGKRPPLDYKREHIFDAQVLHKVKPDYQLCDIIDPMIRKVIYDPNHVSDHCDAHDGWYKAAPLNLIKAMTRVKSEYMHENHRPAPNSLCFGLIEEYEREQYRARVEAGDGNVEE